jgi:hypothetical protein
MKKILLLSSGFLILFFITAFSQDDKKSIFFRNQIGIQFNPIINNQFLDLNYINTVSALRYGYKITKSLITGMEFACYFPININSHQNFRLFNYFNYRIGLTARYSIFSEKRFQLFAEISPYFMHYGRELTSLTDNSPFSLNKIGLYSAPGVTLYSKSKRISFDLYYQFSNLRCSTEKYTNLSYKVNFNF